MKIMNNQNINKKPLRGPIGLWAVAALACALLLTTAGVASADYGQGAVYQIALSANDSGPNGGGVWLWIALYPTDPNNPTYGTGDYTGSDCGHGLGAVRDMGDVTWQTGPNNTIVISGVVLNGLGGFPTTITVPAAYGHYSGTGGAFLTLPPFIPPDAGTSQLQVAP